jgi:hypothetical protein
MLKIKDPEAYRLAKELATIEGTTLTDALIRSLKSSLARQAERRMHRREYLQSEISAARKEGFGFEKDPFAELYDPAN